MTSEQNQQIAHLTVGALKTTMDSAIKAMLAAVEAAEAKTQEMREQTEQFIADFENATNTLSDSVAAHVASCQAAIDSFQAHHLKILNHEAQVEAPKIIQVDGQVRPQDLDALRDLARHQKESNRVQS